MSVNQSITQSGSHFINQSINSSINRSKQFFIAPYVFRPWDMARLGRHSISLCRSDGTSSRWLLVFWFSGHLLFIYLLDTFKTCLSQPGGESPTALRRVFSHQRLGDGHPNLSTLSCKMQQKARTGSRPRADVLHERPAVYPVFVWWTTTGSFSLKDQFNHALRNRRVACQKQWTICCRWISGVQWQRK